MAENWNIEPDLVKIWIDMGYGEVDDDELDEIDMHPIEESRILCDIFVKKGFKRGKNLRYFEDYSGTHDEFTWGKRMSNVLTFLFGTKTKKAKL